MAETLRGDRIQFTTSAGSQDNSYFDENNIGFINVLYGRYEAI